MFSRAQKFFIKVISPTPNIFFCCNLKSKLSCQTLSNSLDIFILFICFIYRKIYSLKSRSHFKIYDISIIITSWRNAKYVSHLVKFLSMTNNSFWLGLFNFSEFLKNYLFFAFSIDLLKCCSKLWNSCLFLIQEEAF